MTSRLEQLREAFAEEHEDPRLVKRLPFPTKIQVVAEYKVTKADQVRAAMMGGSDAKGDRDLLVNALVRLLVHDEADPNADDRGLVDFEQWTGEDLGGPVRFDHRFCEAVGWEPMDASDIVAKCFAGNDVALAGQAMEVGAWMTDTSIVQLQDFTPGS